jgi:branched-chain amino acid transport system permease protein
MLATVLLIGIGLGACYALFALGFSLVYTTLGTMNFAHGEILLAGVYVVVVTATAGLPVPVAIAVGLLASAAVGVLVERFAFRPLRYSGDLVLPLVAGLGAALIVRNAIVNEWGPARSAFPDLLPEGGITHAGATLSFAAIGALALAFGLAVLIERGLKRMRFGWAVQAVAQDVTAARLAGLPVSLIVATAYGIAGAIGTAGAVLFVNTLGTLQVAYGFTATIMAFTAAVIGGITSLRGAVVGGVILGLVQAVSSYYVGGAYREATTFVVLIVILMVLPQGIFRRDSLRSGETSFEQRTA